MLIELFVIAGKAKTLLRNRGGQVATSGIRDLAMQIHNCSKCNPGFAQEKMRNVFR